MFAKLSVIILTIGAVAATLLAARQQRLYAVHESAQSMRRIVEHDRTLWRLRGEIAGRVTPGKVRQLADRFGPMAYFFEARSSPLLPGQPGVAGNVKRASDVSTAPVMPPDDVIHDPAMDEDEREEVAAPEEEEE